jgi:hypothetical protein
MKHVFGLIDPRRPLRLARESDAMWEIIAQDGIAVLGLR